MSDNIHIGIQEENIHLVVEAGGGGGLGGGGVAVQGSGSYTQGSGTIRFQTSPTMTFGLATNGIMTGSISQSTHAHPYATNDHSHGTINTVGIAGVVMTNASASSGLTLGMPSWITGYTETQSGISGIIVSDNTYTTGSVSFMNSNGISFGSSGANKITASHNAFPSADTTKFAGSGFTTTSVSAGTAVEGTLNSLGLKIGIPPYITAGGAGGSINFSAGSTSSNIESVVFSNSYNVSFTMNGSTINASASYPAQSAQPGVQSFNGSSGSISFNVGSSLSSTVNGSSLTIGLISDWNTVIQSAGAYLTTQSAQIVSASNGSYSFTTLDIIGSGAANVYSGGASSIIVSVPVQTVQPAVAGIIISNSTYTSGNVSFSNLNGISFGSNGEGVVTASYSVPAIPGATVFSNLNNIEFGLTGSTITASATGLALGNHTHSDLYPKASFNTSSTSGIVIQGSANSDGISLWVPDYITTYAAGGGSIAFSAGASSNDLASIIFSNSNNVSFGLAGSTVTASASYSQPGATVFSNSNNVTFGLAGSTITASVTVASTSEPRVVSLNGSSGSMSINVGSSLSGSTDGSTIIIGLNASITSVLQSANANYLTSQTLQPIAISGSNTSTTASTISFGASNNFDFYLTNGSVVGKFTESTHGHTYVGSISTGLTGASWTINSSQFSLNVPQGSLYFGDGSGVTFGIASAGLASTVTASINPAITTANYAGTGLSLGTTGGTELKATLNTTGLTISYPNFIGSSFVTTATAGTEVVGTLDTAGLKLGVPAYLTAAVGGGGSVYAGDFITLSTIAGSTSVSVTNTSNFTYGHSGFVGLASTNITGGSATINSSQLYINIPSNAGSLGFNDSNGVTFGIASTTSNSSTVVTASIAAYGGTSFQTTATNGTAVTAAINTAGMTLAVPAFITTAAAGGGDWSISATNGTNILITTGAATHTLYQPAFLTGYTESTHAFTQYVGLTSTAITGGSATIASNQLLINIPSNAGSLGFVDSNGITFGVASTTSNSSTNVTASFGFIWELYGGTAGTSSSQVSILKLSAGTNITLSGGSNGITIIG
jgi:hypothetical protein